LQALLSQIPTTLINWALVIWAVSIFFTDLTLSDSFWAYAVFAGASTLLYFIYGLIAAFKARQGKFYYFLLFGKMAYEVVYKVRKEDNAPVDTVNKPPF
jgi:hypothetical protein